MLDNLREQASFKEEEVKDEEVELLESNAPIPPKSGKSRRSFDQITGMTARQRFILAVMLSIMVCLLGTTLLLLSGKMVPSFMF